MQKISDKSKEVLYQNVHSSVMGFKIVKSKLHDGAYYLVATLDDGKEFWIDGQLHDPNSKRLNRLTFSFEDTTLPKSLEIGMYCVTFKGEVVKITSDDMPGYPYESFKRLASRKEIKSYEKLQHNNR